MTASITVATPDGVEHVLAPGAIIGRLDTAALRINDPQVSETHACVSLRGASLKLLALRGRLRLGGDLVGEVTLMAGQVIELRPGLALTVRRVQLPPTVLAIEGPSLPRFALPKVASIVRGRVTPGFVADADLVLWIDGDEVRVREAGQADRVLHPGDELAVGAETFLIAEVRLAVAGAEDTVQSDPRLVPMTLVLRYDSVLIRRKDGVVAIDGLAARLVTELAQMRGPVEWRTLAGELWPGEEADEAIRARFDALLGRLRRRLRETGLPIDLVRSDRRGRLQLLLAKHDRVVDET